MRKVPLKKDLLAFVELQKKIIKTISQDRDMLKTSLDMMWEKVENQQAHIQNLLACIQEAKGVEKTGSHG